jgi:cell division septation protein DedD
LNDKEYFVPLAAKLASSALEWPEKHGKREARFDFAAEVRDEQSHRISTALQDTITVSLGAERFQQVERRALVYQGGFVLGPGKYRLKLVARDCETGRIGTFEEDLLLSQPQPTRLELSSVLLSSQLEPARSSSEVKKSTLGTGTKTKTTPLIVSGGRIIPNITHVFTTRQRLLVFFQAYPPAKTDSSKLRAGLVFFRNGEWFNETPLHQPTEVNQRARIASFRIDLPLENFPPGRYALEAVVVDPDGEQAAFAHSDLSVLLNLGPMASVSAKGQSQLQVGLTPEAAPETPPAREAPPSPEPPAAQPPPEPQPPVAPQPPATAEPPVSSQPPAAPQPPVPAGEGKSLVPRFAVQVSAFENRARAEALSAELTRRYQQPFLVAPVKVHNTTLYRVRILVETENDAEALALTLLRNQKIKVWIVALPSR